MVTLSRRNCHVPSPAFNVAGMLTFAFQNIGSLDSHPYHFHVQDKLFASIHQVPFFLFASFAVVAPTQMVGRGDSGNKAQKVEHAKFFTF